MLLFVSRAPLLGIGATRRARPRWPLITAAAARARPRPRPASLSQRERAY